MAYQKRTEIDIGGKYGSLVVLEEVERAVHGARRYKVRCGCGKEYIVQRHFLFKDNPMCRTCASKDYHRRKCESHIGKVVNGFEILEGYGYNGNGAFQYKCQCLRCGSTVIRTYGALTVRKGNGCVNCRPAYQIKINNGIAEGILPDGTHFKIDADLVDEFSKYHWRMNTKGYIQRSNKKLPKMMLHWFVLGDDANHDYLIDHINRDKTDCRRKNLRKVTPLQNSMNHSKLSTNKSGYTGVFWHKGHKRWASNIVINDRHVYLGYLKDKTEAAQRYNYACSLIRGEYAGELNNVPEPSLETKRIVIEKIKPYINTTAVQPAVLLLEEAS